MRKGRNPFSPKQVLDYIISEMALVSSSRRLRTGPSTILPAKKYRQATLESTVTSR